ncbi:hypothetical protein [Massilia sp. Mn16-1_5]|uniref:hypothetical protein n=1 Tax=Massilia sp. Mn16-1_5 TaxID=2079199 RepID=UPI00109E606A|nr:hypothetical protein [Massilia sp. Mn16-1_5]
MSRQIFRQGGRTPTWAYRSRQGLPLMIEQPGTEGTVKICDGLSMSINRSTQILRFIISAALGRPKLAIAAVLLVLAALASTMTYTGYLVIGVLADYLGTSRFVAGLLLGVLLARFPKLSNGKLRIVGLLPKPVRRPLIVGLLALCLLHFLVQGDYVPAAFTGFATAFLLGYPWLRRTVFDRTIGSVFKFAGQPRPPKSTDDMVIDGEFREKKD